MDVDVSVAGITGLGLGTMLHDAAVESGSADQPAGKQRPVLQTAQPIFRSVLTLVSRKLLPQDRIRSR